MRAISHSPPPPLGSATQCLSPAAGRRLPRVRVRRPNSVRAAATGARPGRCGSGARSGAHASESACHRQPPRTPCRRAACALPRLSTVGAGGGLIRVSRRYQRRGLETVPVAPLHSPARWQGALGRSSPRILSPGARVGQSFLNGSSSPGPGAASHAQSPRPSASEAASRRPLCLSRRAVGPAKYTSESSISRSCIEAKGGPFCEGCRLAGRSRPAGAANCPGCVALLIMKLAQLSVVLESGIS